MLALRHKAYSRRPLYERQQPKPDLSRTRTRPDLRLVPPSARPEPDLHLGDSAGDAERFRYGASSAGRGPAS